jgi:glycosyltransferase involved in cell wall biosynthesis
MNKKIKIAFIKIGGLSAGGTEKFLQVMAANLPKDRFEVDYYYCDDPLHKNSDYKPMVTDPLRVKFMQDNKINLVKFNIGSIDMSTYTHDWIDTDFWEKFDESKYDIIQTGRAGHPEYPFYKIKHTPIVDSLHLSGMVDNQFNVSRVMHICKWNADKWIKRGGDKDRIVFVSLFLDIPNKKYQNLRKELGIENKFVYGMYQRNSDDIFSPIPLQAYKKMETDDSMFVLMNGSELYKKQAQELKIKNIVFLPFAETQERIYEFLSTLDVFAHGRRDGEVNSAVMAEALYFGLPIVSHFSDINNGHVECVGDAGKVVNNVDEYAEELLKLKNDKNYYQYRSQEGKKRFAERYELRGQMNNIVAIYEGVIKDPFPHKLKRCYYHSINFFVKRFIVNKYTYCSLRKIQVFIKKFL